ncbi:sugar ABC transporter ATP-binding protein [Paenibacillus alginolyticus]|uniref:sugar ABC transporter ATP-binding protein n=1 Tax=Paenibacillus alginolyticus TaxID=59839 RepID=UPI00040C6C67|nr:sugar ABC transporter ATP-binding protein [Paenibacillus alginolyticus]MCY9665805.1 sugar ABC transporter ATP-binding protein [Paenibacillus alginolyticus]
MLSNEYLLRMENISKSFSGTQILNKVNLSIKRGEVVALVGENGAGKSTLMKILLGLHKLDNGSIFYKGVQVNINNPKKALDLGISMIHQELSLIEERTVAENIWIGREPKMGPFITWKALYEKTEKILETLKIQLDPKEKVKNLSIGNKQLVEILRAITYDSDLIIMDEPTSALSDKEVEILFNIIAELKDRGISIIYISHKFDELFKIADRATVLRDGQLINSKEMALLDQNELITMMVGREINSIYPKENSNISDIVLEVKGLNKKNVYKNINFHVRKGEILGVSGLMGSGRTEVMKAIFGLELPDSGEIFIDLKKIRINAPADAINNGLALVTEDRKMEGLALQRSVKENISVVKIKSMSKLFFVDNSRENRYTTEMINKLLIKTTSRNLPVDSLSGGNQQKVVIAKWLINNPRILILDEPTRGIDVAAKSEIYKLISSLAQQGLTIIMISSELPEILGMSDRILVMHEGEVKGVLNRDEATQEKIMTLAVGGYRSNAY